MEAGERQGEAPRIEAADDDRRRWAVLALLIIQGGDLHVCRACRQGPLLLPLCSRSCILFLAFRHRTRICGTQDVLVPRDMLVKDAGGKTSQRAPSGRDAHLLDDEARGERERESASERETRDTHLLDDEEPVAHGPGFRRVDAQLERLPAGLALRPPRACSTAARCSARGLAPCPARLPPTATGRHQGEAGRGAEG